MSWMLVSGKLYHCTKCAGHIQVEYEGGAALTHVSNAVVKDQMILLYPFGQPNVDPDSDGYYLQEQIVCEDCFVKSGVKLGADDSDAKYVAALLDEVDATINPVAVQVCALYENPTQLDMEEVIGKVEEVIGKSELEVLSGHTMLPGRKQRMLNVVFQDWEHHNFLSRRIAAFLSRRIEAESDKLPKPLPQERLKIFARKLSKPHLRVFTPKEIWVAENTNPFIQDEHTVRVPLPDTPKIRVFFKDVIDLSRFKRDTYFIERVLETIKTERPDLEKTFKKMAKQMVIKHFIGVPP